jgi:uncharacterized surface protein with fasciclin (FAS1) repeats
MNAWMKSLTIGVLVGLPAVVIPGCGPINSATPDIVDTAVAAGSFNTLVAAVEAAGLVDTLKSDGPFTVFAPTDAAFAKLPEGTLDELLANPDRLRAILLYHVVAGKVLAADVVNLDSATSLLGQKITISTNGGVKVDTANVVSTDIMASNGVIHVIDSVILPKNDIIEVARNAGSFKTLLAALEAAELTGALQGDGPFTVFAPTDEAFAKLPDGALEDLLADPDQLAQILLYHVVSGAVYSEDVVELDSAVTLQGQSISISTEGGVKVDGANVVTVDVEATNGVIHVIDEVILPMS